MTLSNEELYPFGPQALVVVSWYLASWIPMSESAVLEGDEAELARRLRDMFDPEIGGLGFETVSASSYCDWETAQGLNIPEFESGSRFVVEVQDPSLLPIPVRIFSPREWQGLLNWGLSWHYRNSPDALELVHRAQAEVYALDGLADFAASRISGETPWEFGYPFDNDGAMDDLRSNYPDVSYHRLTFQTHRNVGLT